MPAKQIQLSSKTLGKIAEALFLAYTEEQAAYLGGISLSTLKRIRQTSIWAEIERQACVLEKPFRRKVYKGEPGWQGAAWMLERKYPGQLAKPEVQFQLNSTSTSTTNNTLVITAERAEHLKERNASIEKALQELVPPANRTGPIIPIMSPEHMKERVSSPKDLPIDSVSSTTPKTNVVLADAPAPATRTPYARAGDGEANLSPNSKILEPKITKNKSVENYGNSRPIGEGGIRRPPGRPKKIPVSIVEKPEYTQTSEPLQALDKVKPKSKKVGTVIVDGEALEIPGKIWRKGKRGLLPARRGPKSGWKQ